MKSTSDSLEEVKELLEAGWTIDWGGRTGSEYPPNQRIVEFEKSLDDEPYTRVRKLHLLEKDYEEVEKLREDGDDGDDESGGEAEDEGSDGDDADGGESESADDGEDSESEEE